MDELEPAEPAMGLLDLPSGALEAVARNVESCRDLVALGATCKALCALVSQDAPWERHVVQALRLSPPAACRLPPGVRPTDIRAALGLRTLRATCAVLLQLGGWPAGLWAARDRGPRGTLLAISHDGTRFFGAVIGFGIQHWRWEDWPSFEIRANSRDSRWHGEAAALECADAPRSLLPPVRGVRVARDAAGVPSLALRHAAPRPRFQPAASRAETLWAAAPPPPATPPAASAAAAQLWAARGVFWATYGPHGVEALDLEAVELPSFEYSDGPAGAPRAPAAEPSMVRSLVLVARKLTGDPNVPALETSFFVDAAGARPGPYDPARDDPFPLGGAPRPVLAAGGAALAAVDLAARAVAAVFPAARGQVNAVPGRWAPEWVPATFVLYAGGPAAWGGPDGAAFTVVFEDAGAPARHAMDFFELPLRVRPAALSPAPGGGA